VVATHAGSILDYANPGQAGEQATTRRKIEYNNNNKNFDIADILRASLVIFAVKKNWRA
jgi:hypothetical protein